MQHQLLTINGVVYEPKVEGKNICYTPEHRYLKEFARRLITEITEQANDAAEQYESVKDQGLTANTIESEGYLRATRDIVKVVDYLCNTVYTEIDFNKP